MADVRLSSRLVLSRGACVATHLVYDKVAVLKLTPAAELGLRLGLGLHGRGQQGKSDCMAEMLPRAGCRHKSGVFGNGP